ADHGRGRGEVRCRPSRWRLPLCRKNWKCTIIYTNAIKPLFQHYATHAENEGADSLEFVGAASWYSAFGNAITGTFTRKTGGCSCVITSARCFTLLASKQARMRMYLLWSSGSFTGRW